MTQALIMEQNKHHSTKQWLKSLKLDAKQQLQYRKKFEFLIIVNDSNVNLLNKIELKYNYIKRLILTSFTMSTLITYSVLKIKCIEHVLRWKIEKHLNYLLDMSKQQVLYNCRHSYTEDNIKLFDNIDPCNLFMLSFRKCKSKKKSIKCTNAFWFLW